MALSSGILDGDREICSEIAGHVDNNTKDVDNISELPEDVLSFILSFLSMREATKARVLSPRWRYLTAARSSLQFDVFTVFGTAYDKEYVGKNSVKLREERLRFVRAVDEIVQQCGTPKIDLFKVRYSLGNEFACYIDRWINFAVRQQSEELELEFQLELHFPCILESCELYTFPCHLLPPQGQLKRLRLEACVVRPTPDLKNRFNSLIKLELSNVPLDQTCFDVISSGLKFLRLDSCNLPVSFSILGVELSYLMLAYCRGAEKIEVSCINLTTFEFIGNEVSLSLSGAPSLKNVFLKVIPTSSRGCMLHGIAEEDLPQLENLKQEMCLKKVWPIRAQDVATKLSHLIKLELIVHLSTQFDLLSIVLILNAAPKLHKFHLAIQPVYGVMRGGEVKEECGEEVVHYELKQVEISGFHDVCNSLGLARYLLKNAVALERMLINTRYRRYRGEGKWSGGLYIRKGLLQRKHVRELLSKENQKPSLKLIVK